MALTSQPAQMRLDMSLKKLVSIAALLFIASCDMAEQPLAGAWTGSAALDDETTRLRINIQEAEQGNRRKSLN